MKYLAFAFCFLALGRLAKAQNACTPDVAVQFTVPTGYCQTLGGSSSENLDAAAAIAKIGVTGSEVASGLIGARLKARGLQAGQLLSKRADFSCTSEENCYIAEDEVFCANGRNGDYHEPDGTVGNLITGDYVLANGQPGNLCTPPSSESAGDSTPVSKAVSASLPAKTIATTDEDSFSTTTNERGAPTSQVTGTESPLPATASPTSNARLVTSSTRSALPAGASSSGVPDSGASSHQFPNTVFVAVISMIAASFLWRISFF